MDDKLKQRDVGLTDLHKVACAHGQDNAATVGISVLHRQYDHDYSVNIIQPPCSYLDCIGFAKDKNSRDVMFPHATTRKGELIGWDLEFLERLKQDMGASFFANQMENSPIAAENQQFTETMIGGVTLATWAWATWWIPLLLLLGLWKHGIHRRSIGYTPMLWSIVFPLGMYAAATLRLSEVAAVPALGSLSWP